MEPIVEAILNVLTIIALIAAISFIIILLVDLLLCITNKKGSIFFRGRGEANNQPKNNGQSVQIKHNKNTNIDTSQEMVRETLDDEEEVLKPEANTWNDDAAEKEKKAIEDGKMGMLDEEDIQEEKSFLNERRAMIERRKQEFDDFDDFDSLFNEEEAEKKEDVDADADAAQLLRQEPEDEINFDDIINEINSESVTKYEASKKNELIAPVVETTQTIDDLDLLDFDLEDNSDNLIVEEMVENDSTAELPEIKLEKVETSTTSQNEATDLQDFVIESPSITTTETITEVQTEQPVENTAYSYESKETQVQEFAPVLEPEIIDKDVVIEQKPIEPVIAPRAISNVYEIFPEELLLERLEKLKARLKINERDLKGNRKEYTPLARVSRRLERDQEKLRRREAIIARKKVMLYGVNNYVDIDEEKAKKLSEDLDLLDGLRLSVQHCEEVMEENKDRYPLLEKTNQILVETNRQLKDDIAEVEAALAKFKKDNID